MKLQGDLKAKFELQESQKNSTFVPFFMLLKHGPWSPCVAQSAPLMGGVSHSKIDVHFLIDKPFYFSADQRTISEQVLSLLTAQWRLGVATNQSKHCL